jgi:putative glycosyltransferase
MTGCISIWCAVRDPRCPGSKKIPNCRHDIRAATLPERRVSLNGLFAWPGFRQVPVRIERRIRREKTTYTFRKRVALFAASIVDFSATPLVLIFYLGLTIAGFAFATALYFIIEKIVYPEEVLSGFTSTIVSVWLVGGIIIAVLGIIGIYLS